MFGEETEVEIVYEACSSLEMRVL